MSDAARARGLVYLRGAGGSRAVVSSTSVKGRGLFGASAGAALWVAQGAMDAREACAQPVPVVAVESAGGMDATPGIARVASAVGPDALSGEYLARQIDARFAGLPRADDALAAARQRSQAARRQWLEAAAAGDEHTQAHALATLESVAAEMQAAPEAMDARDDDRQVYRESLVFLAERYVAAGSPTRAEDAMRRLAQFDPGVAFAARDASPEVQQMYARAVEMLPRGGLSVRSYPAGCTVLRDGREVGRAPVELRDLSPGSHRIQLDCGAVRSRVHSVDVAANSTATLVVDADLDAALSTQGTAALHYPAAEHARARLAGDVAAVARALGARRAFAVLPGGTRVVAVDVATEQEVGEADAGDADRIRALLVAPPPAHRAQTTAGARPEVTIRHGGGVPAGGIVIGVLGLAAVGAGIYAHLWADDAQIRAEQAPGPTSEGRTSIQGQSDTARAVEIGCLAGGGVLLITGVLVSALVRGGEETTVRVAVAPVPGGAMLGVGGRF